MSLSRKQDKDPARNPKAGTKHVSKEGRKPTASDKILAKKNK